MSTHGSFQHRRAARVLNRKHSDVQALQPRFSPTAIFPGMEDPPGPPDPLTFLPNVGIPGFDEDTTTHGRGHHIRTTEIPEVVIPTTTPTIPVPITTPIAVVTLPTSTPVLLLTTSPIASTTQPIVNVLTPSTTTILPSTTARTFSSAAASASPSTQPSSGTNVGAVVGGIAAGILAISVIGFAVTYFMRRTRKRGGDGTTWFDAQDFRRSAVMLSDPPTHEDTVSHGYNPPPGRGMVQLPRTPASAWGYDKPHYQDQTPSFAPEQFAPTSPPLTAASALALLSPSATYSGQHPISPISPSAAYPGQNPFSPVSPMVSPYEQATSPVLTRQTQNGVAFERVSYPGSSEIAAQPGYSTLTRQPTTQSSRIPADDHVDLDRSSVSPFQAAQYVEISRRLNSDPPSGLASPAQLYATQQKDLPITPPSPEEGVIASAAIVTLVSPSVVPAPAPVHLPSSNVSVPLSPVTPSAAPTPSTLTVQTLHIPAFSTDSLSQEELAFPVPPSPGLSFSSRYRVDSLPPSLPEIRVQERSSVSSYIPKSATGSGFPSGVSGVVGMGVQIRPELKYTNSPLASSFAVATPAAEESRFAAGQEQGLKQQNAPAPAGALTPMAPSSVAEPTSSDGKRPNTVYDPEDAYGGI